MHDPATAALMIADKLGTASPHIDSRASSLTYGFADTYQSVTPQRYGTTEAFEHERRGRATQAARPAVGTNYNPSDWSLGVPASCVYERDGTEAE